MRQVELTQGRIATVDEADYDTVSRFKWCVSSYGYAVRGFRKDGKAITHSMHRFLLAFPDSGIDHLDGDKLNNRRSSLRLATQAQNLQNKPSRSKLGLKRVYFQAGKFVAYADYNGERIYLGRHLLAEEAARAYDDAARELYGPHAYLNFPVSDAT